MAKAAASTEARAARPLHPAAGAAEVRESLRAQGFAVRRGDTFPGLGPDWLRVAVRPEDVTDGFVKVLSELLPSNRVGAVTREGFS